MIRATVVSLTMDIMTHILRAPDNQDEWVAYHAIRRRVLFEARGKFGIYDENHPDEFKIGHHSLLLFYDAVPIGVIRVDIDDRVAWFRRVAIREDLQRSGHGRILIKLAEDFARKQGCNLIRSNVAGEAVGFYERCGYADDISRDAEIGNVPMLKPLT